MRMKKTFVSDPLGDMIVRIRNAGMRLKPVVDVPASRLKEGVLSVLEREGYIKGFEKIGDRPGDYFFRVELKYYNKKPVITFMKRVSKPSVQFYTAVRKLMPVANGLGNVVLTTSRGILSDKEARLQGVGGKILMRIN